MPNLYIANCGRQNHTLTFRMKNGGALRFHDILAGHQIPVPGNLSKEECDNLLQQQLPYGMITPNELSRHPNYTGLLYSFDTPVPREAIQYALDHNNSILIQRGEEQREQVALAANTMIESTIGEGTQVDVAEVRMQEENAHVDGTPQLSEAIMVDRHAPAPKQAGRRGRQGR